MGWFTVRVELHRAEWSDYDKLHEEMEARGFSRQITSDDGVTYDLPLAEYFMVADLTIQQVLNRAKAAATATKKKFAVRVAEAKALMWTGLDQT